jgi:hypothetical protein
MHSNSNKDVIETNKGEVSSMHIVLLVGQFETAWSLLYLLVFWTLDIFFTDSLEWVEVIVNTKGMPEGVSHQVYVATDLKGKETRCSSVQNRQCCEWWKRKVTRENTKTMAPALVDRIRVRGKGRYFLEVCLGYEKWGVHFAMLFAHFPWEMKKKTSL